MGCDDGQGDLEGFPGQVPERVRNIFRDLWERVVFRSRPTLACSRGL